MRYYRSTISGGIVRAQDGDEMPLTTFALVAIIDPEDEQEVGRLADFIWDDEGQPRADGLRRALRYIAGTTPEPEPEPQEPLTEDELRALRALLSEQRP